LDLHQNWSSTTFQSCGQFKGKDHQAFVKIEFKAKDHQKRPTLKDTLRISDKQDICMLGIFEVFLNLKKKNKERRVSSLPPRPKL